MRKFRWALLLTVAGSLAGPPVLLAGPPVSAGSFMEIAVVTHVDINPVDGQPPAAAVQLLEQFVLDSRNDPGVESFILITQTPTTNHFQLIEAFQNSQSFDAHVSAAHTVAFRNDLQPFLGAPYDERLYHFANQ
jgi:quinol monooxygenase YgiN